MCNQKPYQMQTHCFCHSRVRECRCLLCIHAPQSMFFTELSTMEGREARANNLIMGTDNSLDRWRELDEQVCCSAHSSGCIHTTYLLGQRVPLPPHIQGHWRGE